MIDRHTLVAVACLLVASVAPVRAQDALHCASFLHNRDGTWRSFYHADIFGPNGVVHLDEGDILSPSAKSAKGEVARALNELCSAR